MEKRKSLIKAILKIYRASVGFINERSSKYGVGRGQWYFFNRLLLEGDGISQEQLSEEMFVDSAHTARAIKKLESDGYVIRKPDRNDMRKKEIFITEKAVAIKNDYHNLFKELNKILTKDFTPEEVEMTRKLLYRMKDNIALHMSEQISSKRDNNHNK